MPFLCTLALSKSVFLCGSSEVSEKRLDSVMGSQYRRWKLNLLVFQNNSEHRWYIIIPSSQLLYNASFIHSANTQLFPSIFSTLCVCLVSMLSQSSVFLYYSYYSWHLLKMHQAVKILQRMKEWMNNYTFSVWACQPTQCFYFFFWLYANSYSGLSCLESKHHWESGVALKSNWHIINWTK